MKFPGPVAAVIFGAWMGSLLLGELVPAAKAEAVQRGARVPGAPDMHGVVFGIFDHERGTRTGRLKIDHIHAEYRRQGFMMVAWRPQVVLAGVELEAGADLVWPEQGTQIHRALLSLGGRDELVLRNVRLRLAGSPALELIAASARLGAGGVLELSEVTFAGEPPGSGRAHGKLWLTGPNAGRLALPSLKVAATAARLSPDSPENLSLLH